MSKILRKCHQRLVEMNLEQVVMKKVVNHRMFKAILSGPMSRKGRKDQEVKKKNSLARRMVTWTIL